MRRLELANLKLYDLDTERGTVTIRQVLEGGRTARIPEAEIERIKQEVSVQRLAKARGLGLDRHGADLIGLCPFHEDTYLPGPHKGVWNEEALAVSKEIILRESLINALTISAAAPTLAISGIPRGSSITGTVSGPPVSAAPVLA